MPGPTSRPPELFARHARRNTLRAITTALAVVLAPAVVRAQESAATRATARLEYRAEGDTCPDEAAFRLEVATRLGYDPFTPDAGALVRASVTRDATRLVARVATLDASGRPLGGREISTPGLRCRDLVEALAVTVGLAFEAQAIPAGAPTAATPPAAAAPAPTLPPAPPPEASPSASSRDPYIAVRRASLEALGASAALRRLEVTLEADASEDVGVGVAFAIGAGALGATLLGMGSYALADDSSVHAGDGVPLLAVGASLVVVALVANIPWSGASQDVLDQIRADRVNGIAPLDAVARAERTWANLSAAHKRRRITEGVVGLGLGAVSSTAGAIALLDEREASTGLYLALTGGATLALYGLWRLARPDPIERSLTRYERARAPVIVPLATPAPSGATLGVAVTW